MVNAKDFFSGDYLKAEDCKGGEICEFLDEGEINELTSPEGKVKNVLNFQVTFDVANKKLEKTFTPNKSNGNVLVEAFGEDTSKWMGRQFKIELVKTKVFGKVKPSIVVEPLDVVTTEHID